MQVNMNYTPPPPPKNIYGNHDHAYNSKSVNKVYGINAQSIICT